MRVYKVDYSIKDKAKYEADPKQVPLYIVADDVASAAKKAQAFEDDNLTLVTCDAVLVGNIGVAKGFKGI